MVSLRDSPLDELEVAASEKPMTRPPRRFTAVSKLSLVEGCDDAPLKKLAIGILLKESCSIKEP